MNLENFYTGEVFDAYEYYGAHLKDGGVVFRTYAPNANRISIIGEFNSWQEQPMQQLHKSGIWIGFSQNARPGQMYKYCIYGKNGRTEHCDPYGFGMEMRPGGCSIIRDLSEYKFSDDKWMKKRTRCFDKPLNIYELHLGSWKKKSWQWYQYDEIADELISYLKEYGYHYVEFMPLSEHPFDGSWGYQSTGYFAPTSRYGTAAQLMALIDRLHNAGIGVILDFVPVHFAVDKYGLGKYDGTALYEYPGDEGKSEWGSYNFMHSRRETACLLLSAANYWLKEYHFDGLRMDAVSRLIYWKGDANQGENQDGIHFLKMLNRGLHRLHPTAMLIAEDSTAYPGVTAAVEDGGLGFDYKWDMGWTYDTMRYFDYPVQERAHQGEKISFSIQYAYNEHYILPLSHDEVVYGRKTIIDKLKGSKEEKFAQAKLLYLYMMTHPGKKLNFMGNELALFKEWDVRNELDWSVLNDNVHKKFNRYILELNQLYQKKKAFWERDHRPEGFQWVDCRSDNECVFGYIRHGEKSSVLTILNFSDREAYISPDLGGSAVMLLSTDWKSFGGNSRKTLKGAVPQTIPAYTGMIFSLSLI